MVAECFFRWPRALGGRVTVVRKYWVRSVQGVVGGQCWKMRVPVRHLSSSKLECRPNELARGHFGEASKYSVAINSFVYFIS
jgi:hypothetical protein